MSMPSWNRSPSTTNEPHGVGPNVQREPRVGDGPDVAGQERLDRRSAGQDRLGDMLVAPAPRCSLAPGRTACRRSAWRRLRRARPRRPRSGRPGAPRWRRLRRAPGRPRSRTRRGRSRCRGRRRAAWSRAGRAIRATAAAAPIERWPARCRSDGDDATSGSAVRGTGGVCRTVRVHRNLCGAPTADSV